MTVKLMNKKSGKNTHTNLDLMFCLKSVIYRHTVAVTVLIYISLNDLTAAKFEKRVGKEKTSIKAEKRYIYIFYFIAIQLLECSR